MDRNTEAFPIKKSEFDAHCDRQELSQFLSVRELLSFLDQRQVFGEARSQEIGRFIKQKAWEKGTPISGSFELTPLCNLDCVMCYVHNSKGLYGVKDLLPADKWIHFIDQACDSGMLFAEVTGGECLTYPDFDKIYLHLLSKGIRTSVLSNGILMDEARADFFCKNPPDSIQISLYGSSDSAYEQVTGSRVFARVFNNILNLQHVGLNVQIAVTVNRPMLSDLSEIGKLLMKLGTRYSVTYDLMPPYKDTGREFDSICLTQEEIILARRIITEETGGLSKKRSPESFPMPQSYEGCEIGTGMPCGSGRSSFTVNWRGELLPCNAVAGVQRSLLTTEFFNAWSYINQWAKNHRILHSCSSCAYKPVCKRCPMMHEICTGVEGTVDMNFCDSIRRCAIEGILNI